jgi:hypothetical protein
LWISIGLHSVTPQKIAHLCFYLYFVKFMEYPEKSWRFNILSFLGPISLLHKASVSLYSEECSRELTNFDWFSRKVRNLLRLSDQPELKWFKLNFSLRWLWRVLSSEMFWNVIWCKFTDVSDKRTVSIFRVEE